MPKLYHSAEQVGYNYFGIFLSQDGFYLLEKQEVVGRQCVAIHCQIHLPRSEQFGRVRRLLDRDT